MGSSDEIKDVPQLDGQYDNECLHTVTLMSSNVMLDNVLEDMDDIENDEEPELCNIFTEDYVKDVAGLSQYRLWQCDGAGDEGLYFLLILPNGGCPYNLTIKCFEQKPNVVNLSQVLHSQVRLHNQVVWLSTALQHSPVPLIN